VGLRFTLTMALPNLDTVSLELDGSFVERRQARFVGR
jgi:hypothetical protein